MNSYKFTSLPEFNAALKQFNVVADRGKEDSVIHKTGELIYRLPDESGNNVGVPIKASSIYSNPTLANLAKKFELNATSREPFKEKIKYAVNEVFKARPTNLNQLISDLNKKRNFGL